MVISPVHYIAVPLLAAFTIPLLSKYIHKELARIVPGIVLLYSVFVSIVLMMQVSEVGIISEKIAGWSAPWGINLVFSPFSGFLASLMSVVGFLIWLYSYNFKKIEQAQSQKYHILQMMMVTGAIGIVLTGGVFQNYLLFCTVFQALQQQGFDVLSPLKMPANDGGLSLGQAVIAAHAIMAG
jgi:formate hydrogenlyase subunit 3/multisubunit Na+/H+ antiporter MnhD subunit